MKKKYLEYIVYCSENMTLENAWKSQQNYSLTYTPSTLFLSWQSVMKNISTSSATKDKKMSSSISASLTSPDRMNQKKTLVSMASSTLDNNSPTISSAKINTKDFCSQISTHSLTENNFNNQTKNDNFLLAENNVSFLRLAKNVKQKPRKDKRVFFFNAPWKKKKNPFIFMFNDQFLQVKIDDLFMQLNAEEKKKIEEISKYFVNYYNIGISPLQIKFKDYLNYQKNILFENLYDSKELKEIFLHLLVQSTYFFTRLEKNVKQETISFNLVNKSSVKLNSIVSQSINFNLIFQIKNLKKMLLTLLNMVNSPNSIIHNNIYFSLFKFENVFCMRSKKTTFYRKSNDIFNSILYSSPQKNSIPQKKDQFSFDLFKKVYSSVTREEILFNDFQRAENNVKSLFNKAALDPTRKDNSQLSDKRLSIVSSKNGNYDFYATKKSLSLVELFLNNFLNYKSSVDNVMYSNRTLALSLHAKQAKEGRTHKFKITQRMTSKNIFNDVFLKKKRHYLLFKALAEEKKVLSKIIDFRQSSFFLLPQGKNKKKKSNFKQFWQKLGFFQNNQTVFLKNKVKPIVIIANKLELSFQIKNKLKKRAFDFCINKDNYQQIKNKNKSFFFIDKNAQNNSNFSLKYSIELNTIASGCKASMSMEKQEPVPNFLRNSISRREYLDSLSTTLTNKRQIKVKPKRWVFWRNSLLMETKSFVGIPVSKVLSNVENCLRSPISNQYIIREGKNLAISKKMDNSRSKYNRLSFFNPILKQNIPSASALAVNALRAPLVLCTKEKHVNLHKQKVLVSSLRTSDVSNLCFSTKKYKNAFFSNFNLKNQIKQYLFLSSNQSSSYAEDKNIIVSKVDLDLKFTAQRKKKGFKVENVFSKVKNDFIVTTVENIFPVNDNLPYILCKKYFYVVKKADYDLQQVENKASDTVAFTWGKAPIGKSRLSFFSQEILKKNTSSFVFNWIFLFKLKKYPCENNNKIIYALQKILFNPCFAQNKNKTIVAFLLDFSNKKFEKEDICLAFFAKRKKKVSTYLQISNDNLLIANNFLTNVFLWCTLSESLFFSGCFRIQRRKTPLVKIFKDTFLEKKKTTNLFNDLKNKKIEIFLGQKIIVFRNLFFLKKQEKFTHVNLYKNEDQLKNISLKLNSIIQKKAISMAIQIAWKNLYKKVFKNSQNKANVIISKIILIKLKRMWPFLFRSDLTLKSSTINPFFLRLTKKNKLLFQIKEKNIFNLINFNFHSVQTNLFFNVKEKNKIYFITNGAEDIFFLINNISKKTGKDKFLYTKLFQKNYFCKTNNIFNNVFILRKNSRLARIIKIFGANATAANAPTDDEALKQQKELFRLAHYRQLLVNKINDKKKKYLFFFNFFNSKNQIFSNKKFPFFYTNRLYSFTGKITNIFGETPKDISVNVGENFLWEKKKYLYFCGALHHRRAIKISTLIPELTLCSSQYSENLKCFHNFKNLIKSYFQKHVIKAMSLLELKTTDNKLPSFLSAIKLINYHTFFKVEYKTKLSSNVSYGKQRTYSSVFSKAAFGPINVPWEKKDKKENNLQQKNDIFFIGTENFVDHEPLKFPWLLKNKSNTLFLQQSWRFYRNSLDQQALLLANTMVQDFLQDPYLTNFRLVKLFANEMIKPLIKYRFYQFLTLPVYFFLKKATFSSYAGNLQNKRKTVFSFSSKVEDCLLFLRLAKNAKLVSKIKKRTLQLPYARPLKKKNKTSLDSYKTFISQYFANEKDFFWKKKEKQIYPFLRIAKNAKQKNIIDKSPKMYIAQNIFPFFPIFNLSASCLCASTRNNQIKKQTSGVSVDAIGAALLWMQKNNKDPGRMHHEKREQLKFQRKTKYPFLLSNQQNSFIGDFSAPGSTLSISLSNAKNKLKNKKRQTLLTKQIKEEVVDVNVRRKKQLLKNVFCKQPYIDALPLMLSTKEKPGVDTPAANAHQIKTFGEFTYIQKTFFSNFNLKNQIKKTSVSPSTIVSSSANKCFILTEDIDGLSFSFHRLDDKLTANSLPHQRWMDIKKGYFLFPFLISLKVYAHSNFYKDSQLMNNKFVIYSNSKNQKLSMVFDWSKYKNVFYDGSGSINKENSIFYVKQNKDRKEKPLMSLTNVFSNAINVSQLEKNKLSINHQKSQVFSTLLEVKGKPSATALESLEISDESNNSKRLFNNIYCLSHRYRWEIQKDWQYFLFFITAASSFEDKPISIYKQRISYSTNFSKDTILVGAGLIYQLLLEYNFNELKKIDRQNRILLYELNKQVNILKKLIRKTLATRSDKKQLREFFQKRDQLIRRTKLIRKLFRKDSQANLMILSILPVLPPDLRPIIKIQDQIAASDLNRLYQRIIYRNDRLKKFLKDPATSQSYEMRYAQRLLQEAVDNLIENGKGGVVPEKDSRGRSLKSLSDILKGKQGRFRQHLLGKRVDYSGRSVIVVGPKLKLHECGLPKEMAIELFLPFLLKRLIHYKIARTVLGAKTILKTNKTLTWQILREVMQNHPILLNRAPTLHRLGIQAFQPVLIEGRAILLHPLVCPAFNADFDGDQMAVHVPITVEARTEAWKLMFSQNNLLSPATGDPLSLPSQDMVLGCYYLTTDSMKFQRGSGLYFSNIEQVMKAFNQKKIDLHAIIWVKWEGFFENGNDGEEPLEVRINHFGYIHEIYLKYQSRYDSQGLLLSQIIRTTPGRIFFNLVVQKCF